MELDEIHLVNNFEGAKIYINSNLKTILESLYQVMLFIVNKILSLLGMSAKQDDMNNFLKDVEEKYNKIKNKIDELYDKINKTTFKNGKMENISTVLNKFIDFLK